MSDLIERLRRGCICCGEVCEMDYTSEEAADEIERLTASNNRLHINGTRDELIIDDLKTEIERLTAHVAKLEARLNDLETSEGLYYREYYYE